MKEPQHYINCGYEDHGYVSPELSSTDFYPDYIAEEVKRCVKEIQSHQNMHTTTFAFMTDIHYALSYNHEVRMKRTVNSYKEIAKRANVDYLLLGGDYTNEGCKEYKSDCFRELRTQFDGISYYPVHGNHDDGTIWDKAYIQAEKSTNHLTHEELYKLFYNHLPALDAQFDENNKSLYYLLNDKNNKIRYICLDSVDIPFIYDENGKLKYHGQWMFSMSQKQIDWLVNTALKFEEDGWGIIFVLHGVPYPSADREKLTNLFKYITVVMDIADAYKKGEDIQKDYYDGDMKNHVDAEFSKYKRGEMISFIVGDHHADVVEYSKAGIPYIFTANAVMYYSGAHTAVPRTDGTKSEILFDVMTLDKKDRKIYITRMGAGSDRIVEY